MSSSKAARSPRWAATSATTERARKRTPGLTVLDLKGKLVVPGLIDIHTHLREPGYEYKETVESGCEAAVAGGFTSIACMPNTNPVNDNRSVTEFILRQARKANLANVYPIAAISRGSEGKMLSEFGDLKEAGAAGFSDDGRPVMHAGLMKRALEYAHSLELPIVAHCEELQLSKGGLMNEGLSSTELGMPGIPTISEDIMVMRDILIAEYVGTSVHICHVSSAGAVRIIRQARERGVKVTAETAPHYLLLTDEALKDFGTSFKVNPPLRSAEDVAAVRAGLRDGTIEVIASDHAPHSAIEKEVEFEYAASGMVGLETSLGPVLEARRGGASDPVGADRPDDGECRPRAADSQGNAQKRRRRRRDRHRPEESLDGRHPEVPLQEPQLALRRLEAPGQGGPHDRRGGDQVQ